MNVLVLFLNESTFSSGAPGTIFAEDEQQHPEETVRQLGRESGQVRQKSSESMYGGVLFQWLFNVYIYIYMYMIMLSYNAYNYIYIVCAVYVIKMCTCTIHGSNGMVSSQRSDYPDCNDSTIGLYPSTHRLTRIV